MRTHVLILRRPESVVRDAFARSLQTATQHLGLVAPVIDLVAPPAEGAPASVVDAMLSWEAGAGNTLRAAADALAPAGTIVGGYTADALVHWDHAPGTHYPFTMVACSCRISGTHAGAVRGALPRTRGCRARAPPHHSPL